jgi:hypothetical protein
MMKARCLWWRVGVLIDDAWRQDGEGETPLDYAITCDHKEVVAILVGDLVWWLGGCGVHHLTRLPCRRRRARSHRRDGVGVRGSCNVEWRAGL